ncbi:MAG: fumarylacetoacetate hydrolase family protein [Clostridiales bacterium]|nr:fumarylacetoacetate hydrolase family protein [Clostridiales bacterium]
MRWVFFTVDGNEYVGFLKDDQIMVVQGDPFQRDYWETGDVFRLDDVVLTAPCRPTKIVCIGLNYKDHAQEMKMELPEEPILFLKPPSAVLPHGGDIVYPDGVKRLDYEGELAVVIGKRAKNVPAAEALQYVFGYTCSNDVTARDLQKKDQQWTRAKSFDTFCPLGPWIATDLDSANLNISLEVNGVRKQASNTSQLAFAVPELIAFVSGVMTLEPGDVILTGTPSGVGPLQKGDTVTVKIDGVGELTNTVV